MIKHITLLILSTLSIQAFGANDLIITNANIINPTEKLAPKKGYIIIHNGIIKKVGYDQFKPPIKTTVFDAKNQFVIPGLIDSHNHVDTVLGLNNQEYATHSKLVADYQQQLPRSYLYFGYTTIIDLNPPATQNAIRIFNANKTHPDLYTCGGGIMLANGYPMNLLPMSERFTTFPNFLYEPNQQIKLPTNIDPKQHIPTAIIKRIVDAHAVCVKIFYEPGFGDEKNLPLPTLASVREIVRLAHQHHLPVIVHANSLDAQKFVLASGADIFAHGLWNWGTYDGTPGLPLPIKNVLNKIMTNHLGYQPTMQVINGLIALTDANFLNDPELTKVLPKSLLDWYRTQQGQWYVNLILNNLSRETVKNRLEIKENQVSRVVNYLQKNHGNLLFGTDTPSSPTYGNPPGYNGFLEMQNWYHAGVSLSQIFIAATIRNAEFFHLEKKYGSIATDKIANLIIMKKNPLKDISAYDAITTVILHGKAYHRAEFNAQRVE